MVGKGGRGGHNGQNQARGHLPSSNAIPGSAGWDQSEDSEVNAHLPERFRRGAGPTSQQKSSSSSRGSEFVLNLEIRRYVQTAGAVVGEDSPPWLSQPEVPASGEVLVLNDDDVNIPPNKVNGPWRNKEKYLSSHYSLLREDAVAPLRDAVDEFRKNPDMMEGDSKVVRIYEKVHIAAFTFAPLGVAAKIRFSMARVGKKITWKFSKRLLGGTMVALSPAKDKFRTKCIVALVAARPITGVEDTPPHIDIYFSRAEDVEIDPQQEWTMLEPTTGYYEAYKHTLRALQKLSKESFPLADEICKPPTKLEAPKYLLSSPSIDLRAAFNGNNQQHAMQHVNVLENWPSAPEEVLDKSQWAAMQQILTKRLSIVQGPPGTGKTYVSKIALQIMMANRKSGDPPIIIAAQTNHALDQLLAHVSKFDPDYIRLGGQTKKPEIKKRALYEVRQNEQLPPLPGSLFGKANAQMKVLVEKMVDTLSPLNRDTSRGPFSAQMLLDLGILTEVQKDSLEQGAAQWVTAGDLKSENAMQLWLNKALLPFQVVYKLDNFGFEEEDIDLEFEQVTELQAEMGVTDDEDAENLKGKWCTVDDRYTIARAGGAVRKTAEELLQKTPDLWKIKENLRGPVYGIMQEKAKAVMLGRFREQAKTYEKLVRDLKVGKWEQDAAYLQRVNFIGMTTTGLSKYRPLVASLKPKIILIEEAAEVIEAPVTAACVESLEHLILVGDHQQLQGRGNIKELGEPPYNLNVSMFERLVQNNMPFKTLVRQRRMDPEFRRLLHPIYPYLEDHPDVVNRPPLPVGLGTMKSFFFDHEYPEYKDSQLSSYNEREAEFIAGFYYYLLQNGAHPNRITILTFYNGQRKRILLHLKAREQIAHHYTNVVTVDSYQGEENGIIILSLVRNNDRGDIGFVDVPNRVCVALSRAMCGFYIFGNRKLLAASSPLWSNVLNIMDKNPKRIGSKFPIVCQKHGRQSLITYPEDWRNNHGGCDLACTENLPCGHRCPMKCHQIPHHAMKCQRPCERSLPCGHKCTKVCSEVPCFYICDRFAKRPLPPRGPPEDEGPSCSKQGPPVAVTDNTWSNEAANIGTNQKGRSSPNKEARGNNNQGAMGALNFRSAQPSDQQNSYYFNETSTDGSSSATVKLGPANQLVSLTHYSSNTSGTSLHTPSSTSGLGFGFGKGSQHSPEKQTLSCGQWATYAAGGVKKDDSRREKDAKKEAKLAQEQRMADALLIDFEAGSPVKNEKVEELKNGRKKYTEEYQPAMRGRSPSISDGSVSGQSSGKGSLISLLD